ncbi:hypothetical protein H0A36_17010 [Endozoicomonas sp. SM1973]|uniref:Uncharacterized protein n=1 Tax=Spartinivicinus marinus TaxID=2994442 RepID=A0A853IEX5_9GAMM|nr:hypothetical protein [Spartinivicinus marinus]MCX4029095.1 hypothetical protein [Spartinivicinus marinus]NYZ67715.1 hypothetical protein [Spartinivicinus marinus]
MDDPVSVLRMAERLLVVLIGGFTIYLGYRLFFHLPLENNQSGKLTLPGVKIVLSRVGPGTFFVAFGSLVLYYSLTHDVEISRVNTQTGHYQSTSTEAFIGMAPVPKQHAVKHLQNTLETRTRILTTIEMLNCANHLLKQQPSNNNTQQQIALAIRNAKQVLLLSVWDIEQWGPVKQLSTITFSEYPPPVKALFDALYPNCSP